MNCLIYSQPAFLKTLWNMARAVALLIPLSLSGCATVGHEFPAGQVSTIKIGETTQNDIYTTFGAPWRTGIDNGMKTWTYGHYRYSLFSEGSTEDLVIKFDPRGVVSSYVFNTSKRSK
jgi:outer membrane protein assembly factor BamE (lipoprotein component of BamABCDE complex)